MKNVAKLCLLGMLLFSCEKDAVETNSNPNFRNNDRFTYVNFEPNRVIYTDLHLSIDVDNDSIQDFRFEKVSEVRNEIHILNENYQITLGSFRGSGSGNIDTISFGENVEQKHHYWTEDFNLNYANYIGVRKIKAQDTTYGWVKFNLYPDSIEIDSYFFRKTNDNIIRAGIYDYETQ